MSRRKAEMVLELVDRATRPARRFIALQRRMGQAVESSNRAASRTARNTDRAASRTERTLANLARTGRRAFRTVANSADHAGRAVADLHRRTVQIGRFGVGQIGSGFRRSRRGILAGSAAISAAYGSVAVAAGLLTGTASEFERFQTILVTTEGSAEAAQAAMGWVQNFAVSTPYELDQVTDAFVQLRAYGLDPTQGLLQTLGDTSAAMGRPLGQAVEAIADAVMGQNERLLEFGIRASTVGDQITYSYTNAAGEAMTATAAATDRMAIQQTLMGIMNEKYAGSMERLSQTWDGMIFNVFDLWTKFQMMIMNAGLFDWMKGKLRQILDTINQMEADGTLQEWATQIGQTIQTALTNIWEFGRGVWEVIQQVSGYLSVAADYVGGWKNLSMILAGIAFAPTLISTAAGLVQIASGLAALSTALLANPIILAIALIAGGVYLIYRNWDTIGPYFRALWDGVKATVSTVWEWLKSAFAWTPLGMIVNNWGTISEALSGPIEAGKATIDVVWNAVKSLFNWNPSETISTAWAGISAALSSPVETGRALASAAWDGLKTIFSWTPLGLITSNWSSISAALSNPLETGRAAIDVVWNGLKTLFAWTPLGMIAGNWEGIGAALASPIDTAKGWTQAAWDRVKAIFSADWLPQIDTTTLAAAIDTMTGIVQRGWDTLSDLFDSIVSAAVAVGESVGEAISAAVSGAQAALSALGGDRGVERIFGQLDALAARGIFGDDFVQGQALTEALSAGEVSLEAYRRSLEAVAAEGGTFAQTAREMIEASRQLDDFRMPEPVTPELPQMEDTEAVMAKLSEIETIAARVPGIVSDAVGSAQSTLDAMNFGERGAQLMQTLADGIRSKVAEVTAAAQEITRAIRNALPRSATMNIGVQGAAPVQERASGGPFNPGWLLTGENGPELEYRTRGGFIAHSQALRNMVSMSQTVARNAANANRAPGWLKGAALVTGIAASSALPAAALNMQPEPSSESSAPIGAKYLGGPNSGGSTSVSAPITLTIQGNVDQSVMPDIERALQAVKDEIIAHFEDEARSTRRREHD